MDKIAEGVTPLDKELIVDDAKMGSAILSIRAKIQIFSSKPLCRHLETVKHWKMSKPSTFSSKKQEKHNIWGNQTDLRQT